MIIYVEDLAKYLADSKHSEIIAISNGYINSYEFHKPHTQRHTKRKKKKNNFFTVEFNFPRKSRSHDGRKFKPVICKKNSDISELPNSFPV